MLTQIRIESIPPFPLLALWRLAIYWLANYTDHRKGYQTEHPWDVLTFCRSIPAYAGLDPRRLGQAGEKSFHWDLGWGGLVALGCALEVGETWVSIKDWFRFRRFGAIAEENHSSWHKPIAAIGLLFVIVGIVGETVCEAFVSEEETNLRAHDEGILGQAQQQAASANQVSAQLGKDTQALKTEAETQKGIAEKERLARLKLEREMSPRRLTTEQIEDIGHALKPSAGKTVSVATYRSDPEAMILALQIMEG